MAQVELILFVNESFWNNYTEEAGVQVTRLLGGYAVAALPEEEVEEYLKNPGILYAELPTRVFTTVEFSRSASCINNRPTAPYVPDNLSGSGVLVGIVDSGIDIAHPDFRKEDNSTRIVAYWDQNSDAGAPPEGYHLGTLFSEEQINVALEEGTAIFGTDLSGHGTHVAGIAAGNGRASGGRYRGVAYESELLVVKLAEVRREGAEAFGTARLMEAVDFCIRFAMKENRPLALNLSYGTREGAHNGQSLPETYLNTAASMAKCVICVGTGNDGIGRTHAGGRMKSGEPLEVELAVEGVEKTLQMELWSNFTDDFSVEVIAPNGESVEFTYGEGEPVNAFGSAFLYSATGKTAQIGTTKVEGLWSAPTVYQNLSKLRVNITSAKEQLGVGIWRLRLLPKRIVSGEYDIWILQGTESSNSGFILPDSYRTLTIPSTAAGVISVGAYDFANLRVAAFSGRGTARESGRMKPDLIAPGVDVVSCAPGGGYTARTGTSMATPFVTGGAALFLEWGVVRGNDPYLYGEKLREYLLKGAKRVAGEEYPNPVAGFGRLCINDSFPKEKS